MCHYSQQGRSCDRLDIVATDKFCMTPPTQHDTAAGRRRVTPDTSIISCHLGWLHHHPIASHNYDDSNVADVKRISACRDSVTVHRTGGSSRANSERSNRLQRALYPRLLMMMMTLFVCCIRFYVPYNVSQSTAASSAMCRRLRPHHQVWSAGRNRRYVTLSGCRRSHISLSVRPHCRSGPVLSGNNGDDDDDDVVACRWLLGGDSIWGRR